MGLIFYAWAALQQPRYAVAADKVAPLLDSTELQATCSRFKIVSGFRLPYEQTTTLQQQQQGAALRLALSETIKTTELPAYRRTLLELELQQATDHSYEPARLRVAGMRIAVQPERIDAVFGLLSNFVHARQCGLPFDALSECRKALDGSSQARSYLDYLREKRHIVLTYRPGHQLLPRPNARL